MRRVGAVEEDGLGRGGEVGIFRREDVGDEALGVAVDDGEPGRLDLDHDAVAAAEDVVYLMKGDGEFEGLVGGEGFGFVEAVAEAAAEDFHRHR